MTQNQWQGKGKIDILDHDNLNKWSLYHVTLIESSVGILPRPVSVASEGSPWSHYENCDDPSGNGSSEEAERPKLISQKV